MKKINILIIGYGSNYGGIETFVYNLIKESDLNKYHYTILASKGSKVIFYDELVKMGCNIIEISTKRESYSQYLKDLKNLYTKNKFDIIHINLMDYARYERITYAIKYSNAQVVLHAHISSQAYIQFGSFMRRLIDKYGKRKVNKLKCNRIACGNNAGKFMFENNDFNVFYNGIDIEKFRFSSENREYIRKELNIKDDYFILGNVATFIKFKNHPFLIDVFNLLHQKNEKSKLILIGEGEQKELIKQKVENLGLSNDVLFLGKRYDVYKIYSAMDAFILPSFTEGLSISLCEAQINGLKCYTSKDIDTDSNISGKLEFLDLNKGAEYWADYIFNNNNDRITEFNAESLDRFDKNNCYIKILQYYDCLLD